jgi:hypothetical protein
MLAGVQLREDDMDIGKARVNAKPRHSVPKGFAE